MPADVLQQSLYPEMMPYHEGQKFDLAATRVGRLAASAAMFVEKSGHFVSERSKKLGALAAVSAALISPAVAEAQPGPPVVENPLAIQYGEWQGTGGYPWADATRFGEPGKDAGWGYTTCPTSNPDCMTTTKTVNDRTYGIADPFGVPLRECASYVYWKESTLGVDPRRFKILEANSTPELVRLAIYKGETVDTTPSPGAAWLSPEGNHVWFVDTANGNQITVSDYNGGGGGEGGSYGIRTVTIDPSRMTDSRFVHLEKPPAANGKFVDANPIFDNETGMVKLTDKLQGLDILSINSQLISNNGLYRLFMSKKGRLELYDSDFKIVWKPAFDGKRLEYMGIQKGKNGRPNRLVLIDRRSKPVKRWDIGKATQVKLSDDGTFSAYRRGKVTRVIASVNG